MAGKERWVVNKDQRRQHDIFVTFVTSRVDQVSSTQFIHTPTDIDYSLRYRQIEKSRHDLATMGANSSDIRSFVDSTDISQRIQKSLFSSEIRSSRRGTWVRRWYEEFIHDGYL